MILYENTIGNFIEAMKNRNLINFIAEEYYSRASRRISPLTKSTWKYTLEVLRQLVDLSSINHDCGIRIDYVMLEQNNRFEVIFAGQHDGTTNIHVLELLPWEKVRETDQLDIVSYDDNQEINIRCVHPSYQSISYKKYLQKTDSTFNICSYVYLFECNKDSDTLSLINSYEVLTEEAPVYFAEEEHLVAKKLSFFSNCTNGKTILNLFHERDQLSSEGVDAFLANILSEEEKGMLTEDQKMVMASVIKKCDDNSSSLVTVDGAPGTGKTMLAISCMIELGKRGKKVAYVSTTRVQCEMLKNKLRERTNNNFDIEVVPRFRMNQKKNFNRYDAIFVDEAQMLVSKMFDEEDASINLKTIMESANVIIALYSSLQIFHGVAFSQTELSKLASSYNKIYEFHNLNRNLRYSGRGSGINWLAHQLQVADTGNFEDWDNDSFEIALVEDPHELFHKIKEKSSEGSPSRVLVQYRKKSDLSINPLTGEEAYSLSEYGVDVPVCTSSNPKVSRWYSDESLIDYAAGPYVIQGLEFNYVGVIIGKEIGYDEESGKILVSQSFQQNSDETDKTQMIKLAYYVLLTRGMRGVFIFIEDPKLKTYIANRLGYSSRRFSWIRELASKYSDEIENALISKEHTTSSYSYVLRIYEAINDFIQELKEFSEEQLDGESFKIITDKCSNLLLRLQDEPMNMKEIQEKYQSIIVGNMGEAAWLKLSEIGQKCLISAELTYHDMKDYNQLYDFSAVCVQVSKAVEYELTKRFFGLYILYLERIYDRVQNPDDFLIKLPDSIKKKERSKVRLLKEQEVTLGTLPYIVGLNLDGVITDQSAYGEFARYASSELLIPSADIKSTLKKHIEYIIRIKNDYRNKAAHKNPMDVVSARECLDYVIEVQRTLGQMLDDYRE